MPNPKGIEAFDTKYPDLARRHEQYSDAADQLDNETEGTGPYIQGEGGRYRQFTPQDQIKADLADKKLRAMFIHPEEEAILERELYPHTANDSIKVPEDYFDKRAKRLNSIIPERNDTEEVNRKARFQKAMQETQVQPVMDVQSFLQSFTSGKKAPPPVENVVSPPKTSPKQKLEVKGQTLASKIPTELASYEWKVDPAELSKAARARREGTHNPSVSLPVDIVPTTRK